MPLGEIYIKLAVSFPNDPKVRSLARFGADAGLARDLYVQMCLYCKDLLTDGFVPAEQIGLLVYPLDPDHGNQLAKQLASVGLIKEVSNPEAQGWQVCAYLKRNGTREDVERLSQVRAEAGRVGGVKSRKRTGQGTTQASRKQIAKQKVSRSDPETETETETFKDFQAPLVPASETPTQRANRLARIYADRVPVSNFPAVAKIVRKAVDANCTDEHIERGLLQVVAENRSLTTETLRVAMYGPPKPGHPRGGAADTLEDQKYGPGSTDI